ncbi:MAG: type III PLP-dependent enzyme domain-containing protein, partial [Sulfobacillus sp.]
IYANPCKEIPQLHRAIALGIRRFTFDCLEELDKFVGLEHQAELVLRILPDEGGSLMPFGKKFGCPIEEVPRIVQAAISRGVSIVGVSFHVGSQCQNPRQFGNSIDIACEALRLCRGAGFPAKVLDIGGGFPGDDDEKFARIAAEIRATIAEHRADGLELIAEPGRFFAAGAASLWLQVIGKKESGGRQVVYLNDGKYGCFSCMYFDLARPQLSCPWNRGGQRATTVFGPTCDSADVIAEEVLLPELCIGDWLVVENFGAYTNASASNFNGFSPPAFVECRTKIGVAGFRES